MGRKAFGRRERQCDGLEVRRVGRQCNSRWRSEKVEGKRGVGIRSEEEGNATVEERKRLGGNLTDHARRPTKLTAIDADL